MNLYQETLMDHYRHPRNRGQLERSDFASGSFNPSCGDAVSFAGCVAGGHLIKVAFEGTGCVISQATASMLSLAARGKSCEQLLGLDKDDVLSLIGMSLGPTRLKCALLPLQALQKGLAEYEEQIKK